MDLVEVTRDVQVLAQGDRNVVCLFGKRSTCTTALEMPGCTISSPPVLGSMFTLKTLQPQNVVAVASPNTARHRQCTQ